MDQIMNPEWNLDILYKGLDDPAFEQDLKAFQENQEAFSGLIREAAALPEKERAEKILELMEKGTLLFGRLMSFVGLNLAVDTENSEMMGAQARLMRLYAESAADQAAATKILGSLSDPEALAEESALIKEYLFLIKEAKKESAHLLSDDAEAMIAAMNQSAGSAWGDLQTFLTSTLKVDYDGKQVTLSEIRNLAYDKDPAVRKAAYEAELASYDKICDSVAFSLNHIKNQVNMLCGKRGYESALAQALEDSRMQQETLDAMLEAIREYLPVFRKYLKKKGQLLGHGNGLPWYDLFAPLGEDSESYSLEEAKQLLTECFGTFTPEMAGMMKTAFENRWIDFYPRNGKSGGAFDSGLPGIPESRIMTNYDGTFGAVDTLAHELGHAFHDRQVDHQRILNQDYPMPVAETASTFNEIFLCHYVLESADREKKLALLENDLREATQCIVDIYSRYLFESAVFEESKTRFLMAKDLNELMLKCQEEAYGDGLDPEFKNSGMWICKSHYYSDGLSFYNFPYAFGNLFATGLYSLYREQGDAFVENYKAMLAGTPVHTIEENGSMLGIDLTDKEFWRKSLQIIAEEIEEFCSL